MVSARLRPKNGLLNFVISFQNSNETLISVIYLAGQLPKSRVAPAIHRPKPTIYYDVNSYFYPTSKEQLNSSPAGAVDPI